MSILESGSHSLINHLSLIPFFFVFKAMKQLTNDVKQNVINLLKKGASYQEISSGLGISIGSVHNISKKFNCRPQQVKNGRPAKMSEITKRLVIRNMAIGKWDNAVEASKKLAQEAGINVSSQTVRNLLKSEGFRSRYKVKKPMISLKNRKKRMEFARNHQHWTPDDWHRVVWSDESKVCRISSNGRLWCWKRQGEKISSRTVQPTVKFGGGSVMVWGCITSKGVGQLTKIIGGLDADLYCEILTDELQGTLNYYDFEKSDIIFQQDNDPKHMSTKAKTHLKALGINTMEWPSQSPDLNPIEQVWSLLKRRLAMYPSDPVGINELWERIELEWNKISKDDCLALINSMPERIKAVLQAKGGNTKY